MPSEMPLETGERDRRWVKETVRYHPAVCYRPTRSGRIRAALGELGRGWHRYVGLTATDERPHVARAGGGQSLTPSRSWSPIANDADQDSTG